MSVGEIRTANMVDVVEIGRINVAVWPDSSANILRIANVLNDPQHSTMVFVIEDQVVGFVDGFLTTSRDGVKRWELDLLAVHPDFQRRGIASALVTANTEFGKSMGAEIARGLVALDNIGSQRAFAKAGYETDKIVYELMIISDTSQLSDIAGTDDETAIIPVQTMTYSGLWVEGKRSKVGFGNALNQVKNSDCELAGAVIAVDDIQVIDDALSEGFEKVGRYQWWERPLE